MSRSRSAGASPVIFGEVLFDHFADGSRVLGGAPFNVAWHLCGFGLDPLVVTAVGDDEPGEEARARMRDWGMRMEGVQLDPLHSTGRVAAKIVGGEPTFEIGTQQAYDYIDPARAAHAVAAARAPLVYHGTLALRGDRSWRALERVVAETGAPTYVDLNLRAPWSTLDRLRWCLATATWLKLSEAELGTVAAESTRALGSAEACGRAAARVAASYGIATVLVTRGADGSLLLADGEVTASAGVSVPPQEMVDAVGAGDGFSAVACVGMLEGWTGEEILARGNAFAADICRIRGATTTDRGLYDRHRRAWGGPR